MTAARNTTCYTLTFCCSVLSRFVITHETAEVKRPTFRLLGNFAASVKAVRLAVRVEGVTVCTFRWWRRNKSSFIQKPLNLPITSEEQHHNISAVLWRDLYIQPTNYSTVTASPAFLHFCAFILYVCLLFLCFLFQAFILFVHFDVLVVCFFHIPSLILYL